MEFIRMFENMPLLHQQQRPSYVSIQPRPYVHQQQSERAIDVDNNKKRAPTGGQRKARVQKATSPAGVLKKSTIGGISKRAVYYFERERTAEERAAWRMELRNRLIARMARMHKLPRGYLATQGGLLATVGLSLLGNDFANHHLTNQRASSGGVNRMPAGYYWAQQQQQQQQRQRHEEEGERGGCWVNGMSGEAGGMMLSPMSSVGIMEEEEDGILLGCCASPMVPPPPPPLCGAGEDDMESFLKYCEGSILQMDSPINQLHLFY